MLDVWELCSAYYMPKNDLRKKELFALVDRMGFGLGLQADKPRPEYSLRYRESVMSAGSGPRERTVIEPEYESALKKQTGVIIAGSAGQKVKSASTLFAKGAIYSGLHATQKDDYPITVQTGHSVTEIIISPEKVEYTGIESADMFIVISEDGLNRVRAKIEALPATAKIYVEESLSLPKTEARVARYPFARIGTQISKLSVAVGAIGAALADSEMFPTEALKSAIRASQKSTVAEVNLNALEAGIKMAG
jgi:Pyruvate/2-oxoacid:ferredoxin oxidoreductase gamma subunit